MVGATRQRTTPWVDAYDNRQQAEFIRQLRLLYQRSLRTRAVVRTADPSYIAMPLPVHDDTQTWNRGWFAGTATVAAVTSVSGSAVANAEDPCPSGQQQNTAPTDAAAAPNGLDAAAVGSAGTTGAQQQQRQQEQQEMRDEDDDDSDDEPPGMMDTSDAEDDDVIDNDDEGYDYDDDDEDMDDDDAVNANDTARPFARTAPATTAIREAWNRASRQTTATTASGAEQWQQQQHPQLQQQLGFSSVPLLAPDQWRRPAPCSFLRRGVTFGGCQQLHSHGDTRRHGERWTVSVEIQDVDTTSGYVAGTMVARDVPGVSGPIETFWEGCIVDDIHHTFYTRAWGASKDTDLQHWAKFESWAAIKSAVMQHSGRCGQLEQHPVIYMRWKEKFFVHNGQQDRGLTIAGFYYIALQRQTGRLQGYYHDPASTPFQELSLNVCRDSDSACSIPAGAAAAGMGFATYSFA